MPQCERVKIGGLRGCVSAALCEAAQTGGRDGPGRLHLLLRQLPEASMAQHVLTLRCDNRPGIVAAVATRLAANGGDITEAAQFDDALTGKFFMRVAFDMGPEVAAFERGLRRGGGAVRDGLDAAAGGPAAEGADPRLDVRPLHDRPALPAADRRAADGRGRDRLEPSADDAGARASSRDVPYWHLPVSRDTKAAQEAEVKAVIEETRRRARRARALHAGAVGRLLGLSRRGAASTSTTRSCRASRARSPITRRMSAG